MRLSCNGCRALRKACSEDCSIRPCLQWIKCPDAQANATIFLAKFYGRSGLLNLVNAGPDHERPAIFRSLLYEACGRILNPLYGSVGLLWSGSWQLCQTAVQAVLEGQPIARIPSDSLTAASTPVPLLKSCDIRHVSRESRASRASAELHKVAMPPKRFKRSFANSSKPQPAISSFQFDPARFDLNQTDSCSIDFQLAQSHESARQAPALVMDQGVSTGDKKHACPVETTEASHVRQTNPVREIAGLELTLGFEPVSNASNWT